jgi:hypothetical protein
MKIADVLMVLAVGFFLGGYTGIKATYGGDEHGASWLSKGLVSWTHAVRP